MTTPHAARLQSCHISGNYTKSLLAQATGVIDISTVDALLILIKGGTNYNAVNMLFCMLAS